MAVEKTKFGETNGQVVSLYKITNKNQTSISLLDYAATWQNFEVVENGIKHSLIEHFDNLDDYIQTPYEVGKTIGRVAGRISKAQFSIDNKDYQLTPNDGKNIIHSGNHGLQMQVFDATIEDDNSVLFTREVHGEDGFPGVLKVKIRYTLSDDDEVSITYSGRTNQDTLFNPRCHVYFNLNDGNLKQVQLKVNSKRFLDMNEEKLPTGKLLAVTNAYDFKNFKKIGQGLKQLKPLDKFEFDDAYVVHDKAATLKDDKHAIDFYTDRNGLVIFTADPIDAQKASVHDHSSIAMELMTLPDAINHSDFGNTILTAGKKVSYTNKFKYRKLK